VAGAAFGTRRPPVGRRAYEPLEPLACGQGCELAGAEPDPADGDADGVDDSDVVVASCVDVRADDAEPLVAASATPVTPALSPPAITPVMISRRSRTPVLETTGLSLPDGPAWLVALAAACATVLVSDRALVLRAFSAPNAVARLPRYVVRDKGRRAASSLRWLACRCAYLARPASGSARSVSAR
jgi:hypothetical protein